MLVIYLLLLSCIIHHTTLMFRKNWIQLQCEGHESTCRWAANVMTTTATTGGTGRTGMTGVATVRNGGSWNLRKFPQKTSKFPNLSEIWRLIVIIMFVVLHPDWWFMIHVFESAVLFFYVTINAFRNSYEPFDAAFRRWEMWYKFSQMKRQERGFCEATQSLQHGKLRHWQKQRNSPEIKNIWHVLCCC